MVVNVAHVGEVDPEASASTVEMRAALLQETCKLLKIKNRLTSGPDIMLQAGVRFAIQKFCSSGLMN